MGDIAHIVSKMQRIESVKSAELVESVELWGITKSYENRY
jgi:hypothetical protein